MKPDISKLTFIEQKTGGYSTKYRVRDAKEKLRRAEQLARKQGNRELAQQAAEMRREVDSPFLRMSLQMSAMVGFDDLDDEYYF